MIRFNHMEMTVPVGFVAKEGENLHAFLSDVFGFERSEFPGLATPNLVVKTDADASQFLFIAEHAEPLARAADDHLGFQLESDECVERALASCRRWQGDDDRVEIRDFGVLDLDQTTTRSFYVRYLLPLWFDVQHIAAKPGFEAQHAWQFLDAGKKDPVGATA